MRYALTEADIAQYFVERRGRARTPASIADLADEVERYLRENDLDHRLDDSAAIALQACAQLSENHKELQP